MTEITDRWAAGSTYEEFMGRWSRRLAPRYVSWLRIPPGVHWLDVGCGTGALTEAICGHAAPASVTGCDPAGPLIDFARRRVTDARVSFAIRGAGDLPRRPGGYDSIASLLALNFLPDAESAVREMQEIAAPRGTISACVWDYAEGMGFLRRFWDTVVAVDPSARGLDEGVRFPICRPDALTRLFRGGGLEDTRCEAIEIETTFADFADFWKSLLGGTGPAPSYVASLDAGRRATLAAKLEESVPRRADGAIQLVARAWAIRGTVRG